ncbi:DGQHR domain-containing protein [Vibrio splendidus]
MIDFKLAHNEFLAFRVDQPFGSFYTVKLTAEFLLERSYSKSADLVGDEITGGQRKLRSKRIDEISDFIDSDEASFPNSIILAANYNSDDVFADEDVRWTVEVINEELSLYKLKVPSEMKICSVVDGQHRLFSFERAKNKGMQLNCSLFLDLVPSLQASVFATINFNQAPVDKSLAYNLFGYQLGHTDSEYWSPDLLAVNMCRFFSEKEDSFFYGHINYRLAQRNVKDGYWVISTASFVDGVVSLMSKKPKEDRYKINRKGVLGLAGRKALNSDENYPLRQYYISGNDEAIKQAIDMFFSSLQEVFKIKDADKHVLVSTIGIKALFNILSDYLKINGVSKKALSEVKKCFVRLKKVDLKNRDFFASSTKGQRRLYNCIYSVFFNVNIDKLVNIDELPDYRKVLD